MDFQQKLKAVYKRHDKIAPLIEGLEGEIPQQTLDDYYVKLKTIIKEDDDKKQGNYETISGQKKEVEIEEIFDEKAIRRLLIVGGAGVGKSTLMQYIAYRWGTSGLWKDKFDYVYRVPLKTLLNAGWDRDYDKEERKDELKCLVHYNLVTQGIEGSCKLKEVPWLEKKGRILLLLDGYDEVAHERNGLYKGVFESIFRHENIILTSRPNAIDKQMAEKFGKKIENTGLDNQGIEKYLSQYFKKNQAKGEGLREFLDKNSSIKEICHIPVNIAMMCFIWSEGDSNEALHEISSMSDLYKQVVDHLGFRYFAKANAQHNQDDLMSKWRGGEIYLDELQVLEHTAFKGMTGGGLQVADEKRSETLIIKGMAKKGDKDGISIQSSINYLKDVLKKDMPTINKVYKYGLLKPEGVMVNVNDGKKQSKKEPSETDLQEQSFSFIHLSFQEFLTALYLVQHLLKENNKEEQERIANFIAQHRNEPRYLMTLKLMAGILSANEDSNSEQGIKIFWDAILCNPDGVLELGVETKINLLMHLLGQAKKDDIIDKRIPNWNLAVDLIDSVVLQDLSKWGPQLKESDYISENIKEGLLEVLIKENTNWISEKSSKLQKKFTKQIKKANNVSVEIVLEIIISIMNKFSQDEQNKIFIKAIQLVKNHNESKWQLTKKALETIFILLEKTKSVLDDNNKKKELLDAFLVTVYDANLTQLSLKGMQELLNVKKNSSFLEIIKANIKQEKENSKAENLIRTKAKLLAFAVNPQDTQFRKEVIERSLAPYLQNSVHDVQILVSNIIAEIVLETTNDGQLILDALNLLLPLTKDPEINEPVIRDLKKLMEKIGNNAAQQFIKDNVKSLIPLVYKDPDDPVTFSSAATRIHQLLKLNIGPVDNELVLEFMKGLLQAIVCVDNYFKMITPIKTQVEDLVPICKNNPQAAKDLIETLTVVYQLENYDLNMLSLDTMVTVMQMFDKSNNQFVKDILKILTRLLGSENRAERGGATSAVIHIVEKVNAQFGKEAIEIFGSFLQNPDERIRSHFVGAIVDIVDVANQFAKDAIARMVLFLKNPKNEVKKQALGDIQRLIEKYRKADPQFIDDLIVKDFIPLLQDKDVEVKNAAVVNVAKLLVHQKKGDQQAVLIKKVVQGLTLLLKDPEIKVRKSVSESLFAMIEAGKENKDVQLLIKDLIKAMIPLLKDSNAEVRQAASLNIVKLVHADSSSDTKFRREILKELTPLLQQDPENTLRVSVLQGIVEFLTINQKDTEFAREVINLLAPFLQDSSSKEIREMAFKGLAEIADMHQSLVREMLNIFTPLLQDPEAHFRRYTSMYIYSLALKDGSLNDIQLAKEIIDILATLLEDPEISVKQSIINAFAGLMRMANDEELSREMINRIAKILKDSDRSLRELACKKIMEILKTIKKCEGQFIREILGMLTPIFKDSDFEIKRFVPGQLVKLMEFADKNDTQLLNDAFDLMTLLLKDSHAAVRKDVPKHLEKFVNQFCPQLSRKAIEALIPNLSDGFKTAGISASTCIAGVIKNESPDLVLIKEIINLITPLLKEEGPPEKISVAKSITEIVVFSEDKDIMNDAVKNFIPLLGDSQASVRDQTRANIKKIVQSCVKSADIIAILTPVLHDPRMEARKTTVITLGEVFKISEDTSLERNRVIKALLFLLKDSEKVMRGAALKEITELTKKLGDMKLFKEVLESFVAVLQDAEGQVRTSASSCITELLLMLSDDEVFRETVNLITPLLQHSNSEIAKTAFEILKKVFPKLLLTPDSFEQYLTHPSRDIRDSVVVYLLGCMEKYMQKFEELELMFQRPLSELELDVILGKLFVGEKVSGSLQQKVKNCLETEPEKLKLLLVSEVNKIEGLRGSGIIELAIVSIGQEKASTEDSDRKKLIELAKEVLNNIQLRYLDEEGLVWINKNCEKLLRLSAETKVFYKKVYHKLLEDGQISSLEEVLLIKFINQGLTTSLTRNGQIIFEGKRYKLKGENIEVTLEKIAKTVIEQQQDILAMQYKQHEPIFKLAFKGGMKMAAADIKEIRSVVDSRHSLKIDSWLLTRLKSLKFNSEIVLLEQRSAFGDHVVNLLSNEKLIRFYPGEPPALQEIFGSYIYGEAYQGEVFELADKVGEKILENPTAKPLGEDKPKSKQIYFQQELLKQGNEDRNSAVEEELAKKLDNNRAVLNAKLKSFNLKEDERSIIEDYYEGFVSTFSSTYTSSQAIASGKLSIDDGEDFFSPVNLFIQLSSLAPFGIGEVLSGGLEAVRSHIKSNQINNEAKFVKEFAIDAVELSDLVSKIALNLISNKEERMKILEAKDDEEPNSLINKAKNLIMEKIEKLKNLAEKYTKMKNLFEKEVQTSPAFRLGESDANKIIKEWIDLKGEQPDLRMKLEEKHQKFVKSILGENAEIIDINKISSIPTSPNEIKVRNKAACCEIF